MTRAIFLAVALGWALAPLPILAGEAAGTPVESETGGDTSHEPAQERVPGESVDEGDKPVDADEDAPPEGASYEVTSTGQALPEQTWRGSSQVSRRELEERVPRSAPDALRGEPGVFVQQTAHAQASPFVRGRTGQQTVVMFDDVRMNNSVWRQGPNQYFFTVDVLTLERLDVVRGSASTRFGSDAIGGVLRAWPLEPSMSEDGRLKLRSRAIFRGRTADAERGGRAELDAGVGDVGLLGGVGYRFVGPLESAGPVLGLRDGALPEVPRFEADGRTQMGTGFQEWTGDVAAVWRPTPQHKLKLAWYDYRQFDAPRTDSCPPAYAPYNECLVYDEQFRDVLYLRYDGRVDSAWMRDVVATASVQLQHERRTQERPYALANETGRDDVLTRGFHFRADTARWDASPWLDLRLRYGLDGAHDTLESRSWLVFRNMELVRERPRGQYVDGSRYTWGGAWAEGEITFNRKWTLRTGSRASWIHAYSPGEELSGSAAIDQSWAPLSANTGLEWWAADWVNFNFNVEQGFRAPNLDDMTARQQTGPGFQFENAALQPERSLTLEAGLFAIAGPVVLDAWVFTMQMQGAMARAPRSIAECPPASPSCQSSWSRFQLVNLEGDSEIIGAEGRLGLELPWDMKAQTTLSWARGEGPSTQPGDESRVPLSRIPPVNGSAELEWRPLKKMWLAGGLRWALAQDRLALQDQSDARIPAGGTPGFAVWDLRAGYRAGERSLISATLENVGDVPFRYHGSSVNGPGRSLSVFMQLGY